MTFNFNNLVFNIINETVDSGFPVSTTELKEGDLVIVTKQNSELYGEIGKVISIQYLESFGVIEVRVLFDSLRREISPGIDDTGIRFYDSGDLKKIDIKDKGDISSAKQMLEL
jgi:hypothetical protein